MSARLSYTEALEQQGHDTTKIRELMQFVRDDQEARTNQPHPKSHEIKPIEPVAANFQPHADPLAMIIERDTRETQPSALKAEVIANAKPLLPPEELVNQPDPLHTAEQRIAAEVAAKKQAPQPLPEADYTMQEQATAGQQRMRARAEAPTPLTIPKLPVKPEKPLPTVERLPNSFVKRQASVSRTANQGNAI